ncbi:GNAT family N-acetyltransferase [Lacrimispora sp.]|jgi:putative acetyltransferase|uniref:GNAT family N-acetyltransferase n=1 Tax=Lacrimispora sp. TaxID=2719234 RepID=UPI002899E310|nr:GNAT family N-acetyltransferase [Lacrimispora sp.]
MIIREYNSKDIEEIAALFYDTVHEICSRDYTKGQLDAWASMDMDRDAWDHSFLKHYTLVAVKDGMIAGFGDMDNTGYLDRLYVHKDYQGQGVATALCDRLEAGFPDGTVTTHASITARPFFESRGYRVLKEQQVERKGVILTNYVMKKD